MNFLVEKNCLVRQIFIFCKNVPSIKLIFQGEKLVQPNKNYPLSRNRFQVRQNYILK